MLKGRLSTSQWWDKFLYFLSCTLNIYKKIPVQIDKFPITFKWDLYTYYPLKGW